MKINYKHAFVIIAIAFLLAAPAVVAANAGGAVVAQDIGEDFIFDLIDNGAEIVFASIDPQGVPAVIYGQIGIPSDKLGLNQSGPGEMYDGCMVTAILATQGELLDYIMDLIGEEFIGMEGASEDFVAAQFDEGEFDIDSILEMIGTDFSLLINVFVDVTDAEAHARMGAIRSHLNIEFGFAFADLLDLRIDEDFFPPEMNVTLPFDGINLFIYQITNPFANAIDCVLGVMDDSGFLSSIDTSVFTDARASGAGLLAVPDMGDLMDLIGGFMGDNSIATSFLTAQLPALDGPLAIAAAGYIGDQVLSTVSDEIKIFEKLLGKDSIDNINGLTNGQSLVALQLPQDVNITSYSPEDEALNRTFYDSESGLIFWNATAYSNQPDYTVNFEQGLFPPKIEIARTFSPATMTAGGSVDVNVGVYNDGIDPIYNITLVDTLFSDTYPNITVTGVQSTTSSVLDVGDWLNISYTVTFVNEGGYIFYPATVTYDYGNTTYSKSSHIDGYSVSPDMVGLLSQMIADGMPYTALAIGVVGLGGIINIGLIARGRGSGGSYQV